MPTVAGTAEHLRAHRPAGSQEEDRSGRRNGSRRLEPPTTAPSGAAYSPRRAITSWSSSVTSSRLSHRRRSRARALPRHPLAASPTSNSACTSRRSCKGVDRRASHHRAARIRRHLSARENTLISRSEDRRHDTGCRSRYASRHRHSSRLQVPLPSSASNAVRTTLTGSPVTRHRHDLRKHPQRVLLSQNPQHRNTVALHHPRTSTEGTGRHESPGSCSDWSRSRRPEERRSFHRSLVPSAANRSQAAGRRQEGGRKAARARLGSEVNNVLSTGHYEL
jgi:hypothetical protein